jgi:hypothetical protein
VFVYVGVVRQIIETDNVLDVATTPLVVWKLLVLVVQKSEAFKEYCQA